MKKDHQIHVIISNVCNERDRSRKSLAKLQTKMRYDKMKSINQTPLSSDEVPRSVEFAADREKQKKGGGVTFYKECNIFINCRNFFDLYCH